MSDTFIIIDRLANDLKALQPLKPELQEKLHKKFRLEFNYNSNHIEGNTLTYGETELLLMFDDAVGKHNLREFEEMKNHDVAYKLIQEWAQDKERPLNEQQIKNLNQTILVRPYLKEAITGEGVTTKRLIRVGDYKEFPNNVLLPNGEIFHFATVVDTPILMKELLDWYHEEENHIHPVTLAAMLHYKFVKIHPFDDGNGRVARLLMNYVMLRNGLPPVIIRTSDKQNYLRALHLADLENYEPFINYIAKALQWSLEVSIKAAMGEDIEEKNDWEKELSLYKKKVGMKAEAKIILRYSSENLDLIIENTLVPFCEIWDEALSKFETLFNNKSVIIYFISPNFGSEAETFKETDFSLLVDHWINRDAEKISAITLLSSLSSLRSIPNDNQEFATGPLKITFQNQAYEIECIPISFYKSFLYDEYLSEDQIKDIISEFSKRLMNQIKEIQNL